MTQTTGRKVSEDGGGALMIWAFVCEEIPGRPREISALFLEGSKTTRYRFSLFLLRLPVNR